MKITSRQVISLYLAHIFILFFILFYGIIVFAQDSRLPKIIVVAPGGNGDYTTIQEAVDKAVPGDRIRVIKGVYQGRIDIKTSGTRSRPITIEAYPGHNPIIVPGNSDEDRVEFNAEWIVFQGFEIMKGWDGIKLYKGNNVIRNNKIHDNKYQGILVVSTDNITIEGNTIESNGTGKGDCYEKKWGGDSPKHCHGIYLSDYECTGISGVTIRSNTIKNHPGRGILMNGFKCLSWIEDLDITDNVIENNSWGIALYYRVKDTRIEKNKFVLDKFPPTDDTSHTHMGIWMSSDNIIRNNRFTSSNPKIVAIEVFDEESANNDVDYNYWNMNSSDWMWKDKWREDFQKSYRDVTGWDEHGEIETY